jgi:hypothetical protein
MSEDTQEDTVEGEVEDQPEDEEPDDQESSGSMERRNDEPPPDDQIQAWHQHQKDMGRTDTSSTLAPLENASAQDWLGTNGDPDVMLSIPNLGVDHIGLTVDNLRAHVELHAKVLDLLELHVGADASIDKVELNIENVRVQAMLKVKLENVVKIVDRVMQTIDNNPEILTNLTAGLGKGLESGLGKEHATELEKQPGRLKGVEKDEDLQQMPEMPGKDDESEEEQS